MSEFYDESVPTLLSYIAKMNHVIEAKKFFGASQEDPESGIGTFVAEMVKNNQINPQQEELLKRLLRGVISPKGSTGTVGLAKNVGYIWTMGSPISAITQIGDLAFSLHKNGVYRTLKSVTKSLVGQQELSKEDIGIENVAHEFENKTRASQWVNGVFKAIGLQFMDNVGKETYMGAAFDRLQAAAKKNSPELQSQLDLIFGDQAEQVRSDLAGKIKTDDTMYLVASELYDVQPVAITEMPLGYALGGEHRVWYMLKSYTIKQFDTYRREIFSKILSGDVKQTAEGMKNLVSLGTFMFLMGASSDWLKDMLLGRETEPEDLVTDNLIKLAGITKYQIYTAREQGVLQSLVPPIFAPAGDLARDVAEVSDGKEIKDLEIWQRIPVLGKFYYWWYGAGSEKE